MIGTRSIDDVRVLGARRDPAPLTAFVSVRFRPMPDQRSFARFELRWQSADDPRVRLVLFDPSRDAYVSSESIEAEEIFPPWQLVSNAIRIECPAERGRYAVLFHVYSMGVAHEDQRGLCRGIGEYPIPGVTNNVR